MSVQKPRSSFDVYPSHQYGGTSVAGSHKIHPASNRSLSFGHALPPAGPNVPTQQHRANKAPTQSASTECHGVLTDSYGNIPRQDNLPAIFHDPVSLLSVPKGSSLSAPKQSRLPPRHVARKIPRRSISSATQASHSLPKVLGKRSSSDSSQHSVLRSSTAPLDARNLESSDDEDNVPLVAKISRTITKTELRKPEVIDSITIGDVSVAFEQAPQASKQPPKSDDNTAVAKIVCGPSPWNYYVPPELDGVRHALGEGSWNEYVSLVQKVLVQEIAREKLDIFTRRTFQIGNAKLYKKIENMVSEMIVGSALDLCPVEGGDENGD